MLHEQDATMNALCRGIVERCRDASIVLDDLSTMDLTSDMATRLHSLRDAIATFSTAFESFMESDARVLADASTLHSQAEAIAIAAAGLWQDARR